MKIEFDIPTLRNDRWYPIFDLLLPHIEEQRHTFAAEQLEDLTSSDWMQLRDRSNRELIGRAATAASTDALANKNVVYIDQRADRGGQVIDQYKTAIHPQECLSFLSQPFAVIVENEWFDGAFLLWMAKALRRETFIAAYRANRFVFRHAGGKNWIERSASTLSHGVWPSRKGRHARAMKLWVCAVLDNDDRYLGEGRNDAIVAAAEPFCAFVLQLRRRSIESYIPHTALGRYDGSIPFKAKCDALFRLSDVQRSHYHMKNGFKLGSGELLDRVAHDADPRVNPLEAALFQPVSGVDWLALRPGFGKGLSEIFVNEGHRPTAGDGAALSAAIKDEINSLLNAIYERV